MLTDDRHQITSARRAAILRIVYRLYKEAKLRYKLKLAYTAASSIIIMLAAQRISVGLGHCELGNCSL